MTRKDELQLSPWQHQAIVDMDIDAWYLTPLSRPLASDDVEHDALISDLLGEVVAHDPSAVSRATQSDAHFPSDAQALLSEAPNAPFAPHSEGAPPNEFPPNIPEYNASQNAHQSAPFPNHSDNVMDARTAPNTDTGLSAIGTIIQTSPQTVTKNALHQRHQATPPPAISLNTQQVLTTPGQAVTFSVSPSADDWTVLAQQAQTLAQTAKQPCVLGDGEQQAQDCFIFPPPSPHRGKVDVDASTQWVPSAQAEQLLDEMLASIGVDWQAGYHTPLLKHATAFGQAPDVELLRAHLSLLASELALVVPKRIWLFGTLPAQAVLGTDAPLSALSADYLLHYQSPQNDQGAKSASVICLPDPDYLLALPAEKGKVWQRIKSLG